jgi:hypothetical protein
MGGPRLSEAEKTEVWDALERGESMRAVARRLGRGYSSIRTFVVDCHGRRPRPSVAPVLALQPPLRPPRYPQRPRVLGDEREVTGRPPDGLPVAVGRRERPAQALGAKALVRAV